MVAGVHVRLNPAEKDVFFRSEFIQGVGPATEFPIRFHQIMTGEWTVIDGSTRMNFNDTNSGFGGGIPNFPQRLLRILDSGVSGVPLYGRAAFSAEPAVLANITAIQIFPKTIRRRSPNSIDENVIEIEKDLPMLLHTLAHEVGHAFGFDHFQDPADTCPASPEFWSHMIENYYPGDSDPEWQCRWSQFPTSYRDVELQTFRLRW